MTKKAGRPSKFSSALAETIISLYKKGKTDKQVAEIIGVSPRTLLNWKGKNDTFLHTLKEAKQVADDLVVASLFNMATDGNHVAAIFWLKNRQPKEWRAKDHEITINNLSNMTDEEVDKKIEKLLKESKVNVKTKKP